MTAAVRPRLGAFVVTHRRPEALAATLGVLLAQTRPPETVLVVDNGADEATRRAVAAAGPAVLYRAAGDNLGPAGAAALALAWLGEQGFELVLWGDDDDPPRQPDDLERLLALLAADAAGDVAGVGAVGARWDWRRGELVRLPDAELLAGPVEVDAIGGGQQLLLRLDAVRQVGLPDARLFFGHEEQDFCLRLRRAGWRLWVDGAMMHERRRRAGRLGLTVRRSPLPRFPLDALWRQYYSTRNYIFMTRETFGRPDLARRETAKAAVRIAAAWLRGPVYGARFSALQARAVLDGWAGRMGRTVEPQPKRRPAAAGGEG